MTYTEKTIAGTWYTINSTAPATVTETIDGEISELVTLEKSGFEAFRAAGASITVETEGKYRILPFK